MGLACATCGANSPAGTLFCVACSSVLPAPVPGVPAVASAVRTLRLVEEVNLQPTGFGLSLPDTSFEGCLLFGRTDLASGVVVDVDLGAADGLAKLVSRRHARLSYTAGQLTLGDWQSAHGTWLNKERLAVDASAPVADGDELRLGGMVFRVELR